MAGLGVVLRAVLRTVDRFAGMLSIDPGGWLLNEHAPPARPPAARCTYTTLHSPSLVYARLCHM